MMRVQRRFGKLLPRTADESHVSVILKDFDDADKLLEKVRPEEKLHLYPIEVPDRL